MYTAYVATKSKPTTQAVSNNRSDRSELSKLYPNPKTYEERKADSEKRQEMYRSRLPKSPHLVIALYGSGVFGLAVWFVQNLNTWWLDSSNPAVAMSRVFFSFSIALMLLFLFVAWVNYANKLLNALQNATNLFWIVYGVLVTALLLLWLNIPLGERTNAAWIPILTVIHFIVLFVSAQRIIGRA